MFTSMSGARKAWDLPKNNMSSFRFVCFVSTSTIWTACKLPLSSEMRFLARRKDAWRFYQTVAEFLFSHRKVDRRGTVVWVLPLGGGLHSSLSSRVRQMLDASVCSPHLSSGQARDAQSYDWVFPVVCLLHVIYNGAKHSTEYWLMPNLKRVGGHIERAAVLSFKLDSSCLQVEGRSSFSV